MSAIAPRVLAATGDPLLDIRVQAPPGGLVLAPGCETVCDCLEHLALTGATVAVISPALAWGEPGGVDAALRTLKARFPAVEFNVLELADAPPRVDDRRETPPEATAETAPAAPPEASTEAGSEAVQDVAPEETRGAAPAPSEVLLLPEATLEALPAGAVLESIPGEAAEIPLEMPAETHPELAMPESPEIVPTVAPEGFPEPTPEVAPAGTTAPVVATPGWETLRGRWETHFGGAQAKPARDRSGPFSFQLPRLTRTKPPVPESGVQRPVTAPTKLPVVHPSPSQASAPDSPPPGPRPPHRGPGASPVARQQVRTEVLRQRTVVVWSGKSGGGRSTLTVALADLISQIPGVSVCTWDLHPDNSSLAALVGKEHEPNSWSLLSESATADMTARKVKDAALTVKPNWDLITGPAGHDGWRELLDPGRAARMLDIIRPGYDFVLMDLPAGTGLLTRWALGNAQMVVVLVSAFFPDVIDTTRAYERLLGEGILIPERCRLVLGQWIDSAELPAGDVSACFDLPVSAQIPAAPLLALQSARSGQPLTQLPGHESRAVTAALAQLCQVVVEPATTAGAQGVSSGLLSWLRH